MTTFTPKIYQQQVVDSVAAYFKACHELPSPSVACTATTERLWGRGNAYHPLAGFPPDMPYFCLRVPTGGGKTWLAAKSVASVNTRLLRCEHSVILWLVPSKPIREQTLRALRDRLHPYHTAREAGPITMMDLDDAKSLARATLDTSTTIIATRQAFQVEDEESRKVYQSSGALMHHFDNLSPTQRAAGALPDRLVAGAGFERREVAQFVTAAKSEQGRLDLEGHAGRVVVRPVAITLTEKPDLKSVPKPVRDKVSWDGRLNTLTINTPLTEDETEVLEASVTSETAAAAIVEAAEISRTTAIEFFQTPAELGERFRVPQLPLRVQGDLALFDDPEVLEYPWDLSTYDAAPTAASVTALGANRISEGGEIDVDDTSGKVISRFLADLQRDLGLVYQPENWDEVRLATWLCRNLPEQSLTHASKQAFVAAWLTDLLRREGFTLARVNLQKFLIRNRLEARIRDLRRQAVGKAFQQTLFGDDAAARVAVTDRYAFEFNPHAYAPSREYDGRFGHFDFRRHFYGRIGDFDSRGEFECACWLDTQAQKGRIRFWVRNLVRREGSSFFLQKADGRFYPDFVYQLADADGKPVPS